MTTRRAIRPRGDLASRSSFLGCSRSVASRTCTSIKESNTCHSHSRSSASARPSFGRSQTAGITKPFAVQGLVLPDALAGLDILAESPTGSGKTLAFGVPIVERTAGSNWRPGALVLVPTRELAIQVAADLRPIAKVKGLRVEVVYGGAPSVADQEGPRARTSSSRHPAGCTI